MKRILLILVGLFFVLIGVFGIFDRYIGTSKNGGPPITGDLALYFGFLILIYGISVVLKTLFESSEDKTRKRSKES